MAEKTALASNSPQLQQLEYFLQLSLRASSARIVAAHALSNPHLTVQFEKRCGSILTVDAWLDVSDLPAANTEEEVLRRGFVFSQSQSAVPGIRVPIGSIKVANALGKGTASYKNLRKAIMCKVGIGRAYINSIEAAARDPLPEGYDSWYLPLENDSILRQTLDSDEPAYYHEYFITSGAQILPLYIVQYEYDPEQERKQREKPHCDNCDTALAEVYCAADAANLCKSCDAQLHSANKVVQKHIRTPIGKGADVFGQCRLHQDKLVEFFCSQCHVPVCVYCKMVGHHAAGEAARHKLVSVAEAYQTVKSESQIMDTVLASRKTAITSQLSQLAARAKSLDKHTAQIQAQIDEMYRKACGELANISRCKRNVLTSDEYELIRQRDEIERLEKFLAYQQDGEATQFLFGWARYQQLCQELRDFRYFREHIDVQLDIKCSGGIIILADSASHSSSPPTSPTRSTGGSTTNVAGVTVHRYGASSTNPPSPVKDVTTYQTQPASGSFGTTRHPMVATRSTGLSSGVGGMAGGSPVPLPKYQAPRSSASSPSSGRKSPQDFFAEALGALDDPLHASGNGTIRDFVTELSFAEGEGYISD